MSFTFNKSERLRHKSLVDNLFAHGNHITVFPMRLTWRVLSPEELSANFRDHIPDRIGPLQLLITIPKKKLHRAVDRVVMRRRIREAWRLQRLPLKDILESRPDIRTLSVAIVYLANDRSDSAKIQTRMAKLLNKLSDQLPSPSQSSHP